jgi:hypothetical protein
MKYMMIKPVNTNSWFNIDEYQVNKVINEDNYKFVFPKEIINCIKVKMILSLEQKDIIQQWMKCIT